MKSKFLATAIISFLLIASSHAQDKSISESKNIVKVLSFNILHGATTQGNFDLDVLARLIVNADPDLVAMQEVDFKTERAKKYDLVTELAWRTKMVPLFAKAMPFDGGEYGEGILSKKSFLYTRNISLPYSPGNEPRAAAEATIVLNSGDTITFIGTHLDHLKDPTDRISQATKINEVFSTNKYPSILAGDLNDVPKSKTIELLEKIWTPSYKKEDPQPTFPSVKPRVKIDYVMFYPKDRWKVIKTEVIRDTIASDHCAYLVTLKLLSKK